MLDTSKTSADDRLWYLVPVGLQNTTSGDPIYIVTNEQRHKNLYAGSSTSVKVMTPDPSDTRQQWKVTGGRTQWQLESVKHVGRVLGISDGDASVVLTTNDGSSGGDAHVPADPLGQVSFATPAEFVTDT